MMCTFNWLNNNDTEQRNNAESVSYFSTFMKFFFIIQVFFLQIEEELAGAIPCIVCMQEQKLVQMIILHIYVYMYNHRSCKAKL